MIGILHLSITEPDWCRLNEKICLSRDHIDDGILLCESWRILKELLTINIIRSDKRSKGIFQLLIFSRTVLLCILDIHSTCDSKFMMLMMMIAFFSSPKQVSNHVTDWRKTIVFCCHVIVAIREPKSPKSWLKY